MVRASPDPAGRLAGRFVNPPRVGLASRGKPARERTKPRYRYGLRTGRSIRGSKCALTATACVKRRSAASQSNTSRLYHIFRDYPKFSPTGGSTGLIINVGVGFRFFGCVLLAAFLPDEAERFCHWYGVRVTGFSQVRCRPLFVPFLRTRPFHWLRSLL